MEDRFQIEVDLPEELPSVMGSPVLLTWALENLVKNALDALGGTGGLIRIRASAVKGREILVSVSESSSPVGSSARSTEGLFMRALATAIRRFSPPEIWSGVAWARSPSPTSARSKRARRWAVFTGVFVNTLASKTFSNNVREEITEAFWKTKPICWART